MFRFRDIANTLTSMLVFCFIASLCSAQPAKPKRELLVFEEIPIVTSVSRRAEPITKAPAAISIITEEDIKALEPYRLWDVFRRVPGVDVMTQDARVGSVSPRGFNEDFTRRNQVLIDGRSVYTPLYGGTEWMYLPLFLEDIKRIEVIRGPSILYGTNAFTGVINITTKDPKENQGLFIKEKYGTHGYASHMLGYGTTVGNLDFSLKYGHHYDRGYGSLHGEDVNDETPSNKVATRSRYHLNETSDIEFFAGLVKEYARTMSTSSTSRVNMAHILSYYGMLRYNAKIFNDQDLSIQIFHNALDINQHTYGGDASGITAAAVADKNDIWTKQSDFEFQHGFNWANGKGNAVWGGGARFNEGYLYLFSTGGEEKCDNIFRLYFNNEYAFSEKFDLSTGIMFEHNHMAGTMWSPRIAGVFAPWANNNVFRLSYAKAYRSPTLLEQAFNYTYVNLAPVVARTVQRDKLDKEIVDAYEFGYNTRVLDNKLAINLEVFHNEYKDLIYSISSVTGVFPVITDSGFMQNKRARSNGVECEFKYNPRDWIECFINYTYENISDTQATLDKLYPNDKCNFGTRITFPGGWKFNWENYYTDHYIIADVQDPLDVGVKTPPYIRGDVSLSKTCCNGKLEWAIVAHNIYDQSHLEDVGGPTGNKVYVDVERAVYWTATGKF